MKKLLLLVTSFVLGFVLIGCSSSSKEEIRARGTTTRKRRY